MTFQTFLIILAGVILNALAQIALKSGANELLKASNIAPFHKMLAAAMIWQLYLGLSLYAMSVTIWVIALMRAPVSVAYPMLSVGYVINVVIAYFMFSEPITMPKLLGVAVILCGVIILARA